MITVKEMKNVINDLDDDMVLRFFGLLKGRFGNNSFDSDCRVNFEVNETEVIVEVIGRKNPESVVYE